MIQTLVFNGAPGIGNYNVIIYIPDGTKSVLPAFVFIPGSGETGTNANLLYTNGPLNFIKSGWAPPFVVVGIQTPNAIGPNPGQTPPFVQDALDKLLANPAYFIDKNKLYLTGLSYGAAYVSSYIQYQTDALIHQPAASIIMSSPIYGLSGNYYSGNMALSGNDLRFKNHPAWGFCGNQDAPYDPMNQYFTLLAKAGYSNNKFTNFTGGHGPWNQFYDPNYKDPTG